MAKPDLLDLEGAIMETKGDQLLLTLAIDSIEQSSTYARQRQEKSAEGKVLVSLDEDQLTALSHAHTRLILGIEALEKTFYHKDEEADS